MLVSMTGFGRFESQKGDTVCKAEIRSVNNRYVEINTRIPRSLYLLEAALKKQVKARCARGSFDLTVTLEKSTGNGGDQSIQPNLALASQYIQAFHQIKKHLDLEGEIDINSVLNIKDVLKVEPAAMDPDCEGLILDTVDGALSALIQMREEEGRHLQADLATRLDAVEAQAETVRSLQGQVIEGYRDRLKERIQVLSDGADIDPARLAQETAILADRSDVTEEVIRLESHLNQFRGIMKKDEPAGRKLEFITQEINRETNTIGSKSIDSRISQAVIEIKGELEKIREQLQNIE